MQEFEFTLPSKVHTHAFYLSDYVRRNEIVSEWDQAMQKPLAQSSVEHKPKYCSTITFDFYFTGKIFSVVECSAMVDIILQVLCKHKILTKDTWKYVGQITVITSKSMKKNSYCVVELD